MSKLSKFTALMVLVMCSASSQAMTVWVVESGLDPFSNSQNILDLSSGTTRLDLYYDTALDTSYGYDFTLNVLGGGSISNVLGSNLGVGTPAGSGWRQFGGDINGVTGNSIIAFSFDFTADAGSMLSIVGGYTDGNFTDAAIPDTNLAAVSAVPLPAAAWLFLSGLGLVGFTARRKK